MTSMPSRSLPSRRSRLKKCRFSFLTLGAPSIDKCVYVNMHTCMVCVCVCVYLCPCARVVISGVLAHVRIFLFRSVAMHMGIRV